MSGIDEQESLFGGYWDWTEQDTRYILDQLAAGGWEDDEATLIFTAGAAMALADLDRNPKRVLNAAWMASDVLLNLYELDQDTRKAAEAVWDATCRLARPEHGFRRIDPVTTQAVSLRPK